MPPVKKPNHNRYPTFIKAWRTHRDKSQEVVADFLEIDRTTLSKIERGVIPYNQDFLERLSVILNVDPPDLIGVDPFKPDPPRLIYSSLKRASPDIQNKAWAIIEALLKAG